MPGDVLVEDKGGVFRIESAAGDCSRVVQDVNNPRRKFWVKLNRLKWWRYVSRADGGPVTVDG